MEWCLNISACKTIGNLKNVKNSCYLVIRDNVQKIKNAESKNKSNFQEKSVSSYDQLAKYTRELEAQQR